MKLKLYRILDPILETLIGKLEDWRDRLYYSAHPVRAILKNPHPSGSVEARLWDDARGIVRPILATRSPWAGLLKKGTSLSDMSQP